MIAPPPGIQPGLWLRYYRALSDLERARQRAMDPVREIKRRINTVRHAAAQAGMNLVAMQLLGSVSRLSENDAQRGVADFVHYLSWASLPIGTQGQLFAQPSALEIVEHDAWLAETDGREAALAGMPRSANPHDPATALHTHWNVGWGNAESYAPNFALPPQIDAVVEPEVVRKPGRPKGSKNKPKASAVVGRLRRADRAESLAAE